MQNFKDRIKHIHKELGIPSCYEAEYGLPLQYEEENLVEIENDIYDRKQFLAESAVSAWINMKADAEDSGVKLEIVSAFRSVEKQKLIIKNKLNKGQCILDILKVSAAPGYSEHHTGMAIDITTPCCKPLIEAFESTKAFIWLVNNAENYSFYMSYPKNSENRIMYEPWHWSVHSAGAGGISP